MTIIKVKDAQPGDLLQIGSGLYLIVQDQSCDDDHKTPAIALDNFGMVRIANSFEHELVGKMPPTNYLIIAAQVA